MGQAVGWFSYPLRWPSSVLKQPRQQLRRGHHDGGGDEATTATSISFQLPHCLTLGISFFEPSKGWERWTLDAGYGQDVPVSSLEYPAKNGIQFGNIQIGPSFLTRSRCMT